MNYPGKSILLSFLLLACISVQAQTKTDKKPVKKMLCPDVYFYNCTKTKGPITIGELTALLKTNLVAKDSAGVNYKVLGFDFTYAERGMFEDSVANLSMYVDYLMEYCPGDTISENISKNIYDKLKSGDSLVIDHVRLTGMGKDKNLDSVMFFGKEIKFYLTK